MARLFVIGMTADEPVRIALMQKLIAKLPELAGSDTLYVGLHWYINTEWKTAGGLEPVRDTLRAGLHRARDAGATHVVLLCEDAILHPDFFVALNKIADARPGELVCCQINHPDARGLETIGYHTYDGATLIGGMMSVADLSRFLRWDEEHQGQLGKMPIDTRFNLWAMDCGRMIFKPLPALVDHDLTVPSLEGNQWQTETGAAIRHSIGYDASKSWDLERDLAVPVPCLGRTYADNAIYLLATLAPTPERVERYFDVHRGHGRLTDKLSVFIAAPAYRGEIKADWCVSLMSEIETLREAGVDSTVVFKADSLINRARNRLVSDFLRSDCSHMIMWDTDNFPTQRGALKALLETGHDFVGCAIVLKDGKNNKFAMQWLKGGPQQLEAINGCIEVAALGTAFLMVSRAAIVKMVCAHPELFYFAGKWMESPGKPEWHLFADKVRNLVHLSEDYEFCYRWRDLGGKVYLRYDLDFIHIGEYPFTGSFRETFQMEEDDAAQQGNEP